MLTARQVIFASTIALLSTGAAAAQGNSGRIQVGGNDPVFPESITSTSDGSLFTSSVGEGRVFKAAPHAKGAVAWSAKEADGPQSVLGVYADERSGTLWACYSDMALAKGNSGKPAILRALDLSSGKVKQSYPMPAGSFCNDIATSADDTVYVTDTHGGRVMKLQKGADRIATWLQDKQLVGVDGIAFGKDGSLYLTNVQSNDLFKVDVSANGAPGKLTRLTLSEKVHAPDGLRSATDGRFFLAENKSGKVDELTLSGEKVDVKTLKGGYKGPTSMTANGDNLYIVEAKINEYGKGGKQSPFYVYSIPLPAQ
ncbi:MAG TPA: SMP-30/gluconolactonase/LRE family protein [Burkholderiaceae bacterium]|nr:SMP-30/gluconolactonase/LRE family protein [Burkholderiaceae bacterium]